MFKLWSRSTPLLGQLIPTFGFAEDDGAGAGGGSGEGGAGAGAGVATPDWKIGISEELRTDPALEKFKSPNDLFTSYKKLESFVGKEKLILPKDENDKAAWDQVHSKLGRPEKPEGYKLPEVQVSEQVKGALTPEGVKGFLDFAHSQGLTQKQVSALYEWHLKQSDATVMQQGEGRQKMMQDSETELRRDLGGAYNERVGVAKRVFDAFKSEKDVSFFQEHGNDPRLIRFLASVGAKLSEDTLGPGTSKGLTKTPAEADAEYQTIVGNMDSPYYHENHPEHEIYVKKVEGLLLAATRKA